jgi:hypothetical protein
MSTTWTAPYHGVSHSSTPGKKSYATVTDHGSFADLSMWFPGCGFSPTKQQHDSVEQAKQAAEAWLRDAA